ncbi:MAG: type III secretion system export apparatus subunit SctS [Acidobacteriota bacterium]
MGGRFIQLAQEALVLTVVVSGPAVLAALVVGLVLALIQALTQVQEQTLQMAAKIVMVFGTLYLFGYWMAAQIYSFAVLIFQNFSLWVGWLGRGVAL